MLLKKEMIMDGITRDFSKLGLLPPIGSPAHRYDPAAIANLAQNPMVISR